MRTASSHSFHPPPWDMLIICVSPTLLSQHCWGRWKPTTTPVLAALKKYCFLGLFLSSLLVRAQFSPCSLSEYYHCRPLWCIQGAINRSSVLGTSSVSGLEGLEVGEEPSHVSGWLLKKRYKKVWDYNEDPYRDLQSHETNSFWGKPNVGNKAQNFQTKLMRKEKWCDIQPSERQFLGKKNRQKLKIYAG